MSLSFQHGAQLPFQNTLEGKRISVLVLRVLPLYRHWHRHMMGLNPEKCFYTDFEWRYFSSAIISPLIQQWLGPRQGCCIFWMNPLKSGGDCEIVVSLIFFFSLFFMSSQTQCHFAGSFDGFNRAGGWMKSNLYVKSISKCWDVVSNTPHLILLPSLLFQKSQRFSVKLSHPNTEIISK